MDSALKEPRNWFQEVDSASQSSLAGLYDKKGLSYRSVRQYRLEELIPWYSFLGSLNIHIFGLRKVRGFWPNTRSCCCSWLFCFCRITGAVVLVPDCSGITAYPELLSLLVVLPLLYSIPGADAFLFVLALLCCLHVTTAVPDVLALLYTWSCCYSWLFWYCCAVYLLLPVVSWCAGIAIYLELLLFLVVLALLCCLPAVTTCCSWCAGIAVYLELLLLLDVLALLCCLPVTTCCSWCAGIAEYLELVLCLFVLALLCCLPVNILLFWHCWIPGAVVVPGRLGIAECLQDGVGIQNFLLQAASTL